MTETSPAVEASSNNIGKVIFRNTAFITMGGLALRVLNFLYGVYVVRRLGDHRFGEYNTILAWVGLFAIFAELGITQYALREIARDRDRADYLFWNMFAMRGLLALLGMLGITAGAAGIGYSPEIVLGVFVYTCSFLLSAVQASLDTVIVAHERLDYTTVTVLVGQIASIGLGLFALLANLGLVAFIGVGLLAMWLPIAVAIWVVRRHRMLVFRPQIDVRGWPILIRGGLPFAMITLALTIAFSIDTVMLSWSVPPAQVGWYNVAYGLARSIVSFLSGFSIALVPSLVRIYVNDSATVERWYYRSVKFITLASVPAAVGGMVVAFPLIAFLYNPTTLPATVALQVLIWDVPLLMFTALCGNMSYVVGAERAAARIYGINAIANIALNLYAIPRFGIVGAALVTVVTDLIGALQFHFTLSRQLRLPNMWPVLARVAVASAVMAGVLTLVNAWHFISLIVLGGVVYIGIFLAVGGLDASERALLQQAVGRVTKRLLPRRESEAG